MSRRTLVLALAVPLVLLAGLRITGQSRTVAPPRARPVRATEATIEPLARAVPGGNAVLRVRFDRDMPARIPYETEAGTVVLADDGRGFDARAGDGLYTALGTMDLARAGDTLRRWAGSRTAQPTRGWETRSKTPIDVHIDPTLWRAGAMYPWQPFGDPQGVIPSKSLMITNTGVVEDPTRTRGSCGQDSMGKWSFGYLMEQMANTPVTGVTGSQLARAWLDRWMTDQVVNGWTVSARTLMQERILDQWVEESGGPDAPLDLSKAPFKLLAIVNRMDLRDQVAYGGGSAGELRFVFMHMAAPCNSTRTFQVIFEFGVPASGCLSLKALANQWKALGSLPIGSPQYNAALEAITEQVVVAGAGASKPNGSALNQLRTNENGIDDTGDGLDWEVREFRIDPATHLLAMDPLTQTPARTLIPTPTFPIYVNLNADDIENHAYTVPLQFPAGSPFRGGSNVYGLGAFWPSPLIISREARHQFSLNTCSGCHAGETDIEFRQVGVALFGTPAPLSRFLTGEWVADPEDGAPVRYFDDLQRRAVDLDSLPQTQCFAIPLDLPLLVASH